jgi:hypothetical protein
VEAGAGWVGHCVSNESVVRRARSARCGSVDERAVSSVVAEAAFVWARASSADDVVAASAPPVMDMPPVGTTVGTWNVLPVGAVAIGMTG